MVDQTVVAAPGKPRLAPICGLAIARLRLAFDHRACMDLPAESVYLFRHALVRQAAYQLQPPIQRAAIHRLALQLLEQTPGLNLRALALELADHAQAGLAGAPPGQEAELREKYIHYLGQGADYARFNYDYGAAIEALGRLLPMIEQQPQRRMRATDILADLHQRMGRHEAARENFEYLAAHAQDDGYRGRALVHLAWDAHERGDLLAASRWADEGEALNARVNNSQLQVAFLLYRAKECAGRNDHTRAIEFQEQALQLARQTKDFVQVIVAHNNLAEALVALGRTQEAQAHLDQAEPMVREPQLANLRAALLLCRSSLLRVLGDQQAAALPLIEVEAFARQTGSMGLLAMVLLRRAELLADAGHDAKARAEAQRALDLGRESGDTHAIKAAQAMLGQA